MLASLDRNHDYRIFEKMKDNLTSLILAQESSVILFILQQENFPIDDLVDVSRIFVETQDEAVGNLVIDHVKKHSDSAYFMECADDLISEDDTPEWKKKALTDLAETYEDDYLALIASSQGKKDCQ